MSRGKFFLKNRPQRMRKLYVLILVLFFAFVGTYTILVTRAAGTGVMSITPSSSSVNIGTTLSVAVMADSKTIPANAVQADIIYDANKLDFVSIDTTGSAYSLGVQATGGNGKVSIVRAIAADGTTGNLTPLSGNQRVATIIFKAKAVGSSSIQIADTSLILSHSDSTNVISQRLNGSVTITDKTPPTTPIGIVSPSQDITAVNLSWSATTDNVGVTGYKIYRNGSPISTTATSSYKDVNLSPNTTYIYTVAAYDAAGNESSKSNSMSATTKPDTISPPVPQLPVLSSRTNTSIQLSWNVVNDNIKTTGYNVYRNGLKIATLGNANSYTSNGLNPGVSYSFAVSAFDAAGNESLRSPSAAFSTVPDTTAPSTPIEVVSPLQAGRTISVSWKSATDNIAVAGYNIYRNGVKVGTTTTTSYSNSGLTPGVSYGFSVSAFDSSGNESARSSQINTSIPLKIGDVNTDTRIDALDLSVLLSNYGKTGATFGMGDLNKDKTVNIYDLSMLLSNWKK